MDANIISGFFEEGFLSASLQAQVEQCRDFELTELMLTLFKDKQPVLEAGCGSGKWMHFFKQNKIEAIGLDWSVSLKQMSEC